MPVRLYSPPRGQKTTAPTRTLRCIMPRFAFWARPSGGSISMIRALTTLLFLSIMAAAAAASPRILVVSRDDKALKSFDPVDLRTPVLGGTARRPARSRGVARRPLRLQQRLRRTRQHCLHHRPRTAEAHRGHQDGPVLQAARTGPHQRRLEALRDLRGLARGGRDRRGRAKDHATVSAVRRRRAHAGTFARRQVVVRHQPVGQQRHRLQHGRREKSGRCWRPARAPKA